MPVADEHLSAWLSAYLGGEERLEWELTNTRSGVVRERDGDEEATLPTPDLGAVAAVTDRRVLFLVGGAADDGADDVASVPLDEIAGVDVDEEMLARRLVLTTAAGATWRFTARELDDLDEAVAYVAENMRGAGHLTDALERARERREAAATADDPATAAERYDEAVDAYREAVSLRTSPAVDADLDADVVRREVVEAIETAIETHVERARDERSLGNWEFQAGNRQTAYEHLSAALDAFDRAHRLARECPPGEPDAIGAERDDLLRKLDDLEIMTPVAAAGED